MGEGLTYRDHQRLRVQCLECGTDLAVESLASHQQTYNGVGMGYKRETPPPAGDPKTYRISFLSASRQRDCPVEGCKGRKTTRSGICVHFLHWHVIDTIVIMEGANLSHPR